MEAIREDTVSTNGTLLNVASCGTGPTFVLLHGWPHTWRLWSAIIPLLVDAGFRVVAPDLRGLGSSRREESGYDLTTLSADVMGLLDTLDIQDATLVAIDLGASIAFMVAARWPHRVRRLILSEGLIGRLPGAEKFLEQGNLWWFGFHAAPGLAESSVVGNEDKYIGWFLQEFTFQKRGIDPHVAKAFISAYTGTKALRCGFEYYRSGQKQAEEVQEILKHPLNLPPILVLIGGLVGDATFNQLVRISPQTSRVDIPDVGHLVPLENPEATASAMLAFEKEIPR